MPQSSIKRPFPIAAFNTAGKLLRKLGFKRELRADELMQLAMQKRGLHDFGGTDFIPALEHLCNSLENEAELNTFGRVIARSSLLNLLQRRLDIVDYGKQHPEVQHQKIVRPVFIAGMPRTGTTILFELLSQDSNHRFPISWEVECPVPPATEEQRFNDPLIEQVNDQFDQVEKLVPGFKAIHEMGATLPQECVAILASHFMSEQWIVSYNMPEFRRWLMQQDFTGAYKWHKRCLQLMQSGFGEGKRWLLKTPPHVGYLETILKVYPDACIIQTHRDPMQVLASLSSLTASLRSLASDHIDPVAIGRDEVENWQLYLQRGMEARTRLADKHSQQFFDIRFEDILERPLAVIESMYRYFGFEFSDELKQKMQNYLDNRPRDKHGRHDYQADDYGLDQDNDGALFADYRKRYLPAS
ncbi:hypothetical protein FHR99_001047 [Litorivivens lipolytica]|uniref:Sulfotransferase family protein n=1 Tax=Litorivivens lipolytica TaxID=1524264 RepID=A0A7W4W3L2_9GAMM|nr:sulfotransferase [Litorivivens lipolytica]MBB3046811.1 hypothetical protein [Litorivivens lipolytica]